MFRCWPGGFERYDQWCEVRLGRGCRFFSLDWNMLVACDVGVLCGDLLHDRVVLAIRGRNLRERPNKNLTDSPFGAVAAASKASEDKRPAIEMSIIKQRAAQRQTRVQWVECSMMPADVLTKRKGPGHVDLLRQLLGTLVDIGSGRRLRCWKNDDLLKDASRWDMMDPVRHFFGRGEDAA